MFDFRTERGAALEMALFLLVLAIVLGMAVLPAVRQELNFSPMDTKRVSAEYLAQQGVQSSVKKITEQVRSLNTKNAGGLGTPAYLTDYIQVMRNTDNAAAPYNPSFGSGYTTPVLPTTVTDSSGGAYGTYRAVYFLNNITNPTQINIVSTGEVGNYSETINASMPVGTQTIGGSGVVNLINDNNIDKTDFTYGGLWSIRTDSATGQQFANPPNTGYCQMLFKNNPGGLGTADGIQVSYFAKLGPKLGTSSLTGYGIYYGCQTNSKANNPTSYVFQYDPGASIDGDGGAFFVKKVRADLNSNPSSPQGNETGSNYRKAFQENDGSTGDATHNGTVRVSLNDLAKIMNNHYKSTSSDFLPAYLEKNANGSLKDFTILNQTHYITIDVQLEESPDGKKYYHHRVLCDGYAVLDFVDHDSQNPILSNNSFASTCTGLRTWNAQSFDFYNNSGYLRADWGWVTAKKQ